MSKQEFLSKLQKGLYGLPQEDIEERLMFYSEMIDDRMEDGLSEEEAVSGIGDVEEVVSQIVSDTPLSKLVKERVRPKRTLRAWEIVLLVLGSPIWISLLLVAFAVILSVYVVLWSAIISLWAVFGSLVGCAFGSIVSGIGVICIDNLPSGIVMIGAGMGCAGLSILLFYGCKVATKGTLALTKEIARSIKIWFMKREEA